EQTQDGYSSVMDSPDQGATGIPVKSTVISNDTVYFSLPELMAEYAGRLTPENTIEGIFKQGGFKLPLILSQKAVEKKVQLRPQEPKPPFPYHSEDITFENKEDGILLAGTMTYPKEGSNFPAVVLISGSGPQDRNEELMG